MFGFFSNKDKNVVYSEEFEKALNRNLNNTKMNWGLIILILTVIWALISLVKSILYFF